MEQTTQCLAVEFLLCAFLRFGHEVTAACFEVHVIPIDFYFQTVIVAVGLDVVEGEFQDVDEIWCLGKALESTLKVVAVVEEGAAGSVGE